MLSALDDDFDPKRAASATGDRFPLAMAFVGRLAVFPCVLTACMRLSDITRWPRFLAQCGSPLLIFESCLHARLLHTAASFLLVVEHTEGPAVTRLLAVRVLHDALAAEQFELARDVSRFIASSQPANVGAADRIEEVLFFHFPFLLCNFHHLLTPKHQLVRQGLAAVMEMRGAAFLELQF